MANELAPVFGALGLAPTPQQAAALTAYLDLLERWNATYNLTAVRSRDGMRVQHLADCLAVVPSLLRQLTTGRVLDVGSGGGLPGVVFALMAPGLDVTCVDTVGKKAAFVRQVAVELALPNLNAAHQRAEDLQGASFNLITARAFSSLADLARLTRGALAPGGVWMALKGKHPGDELAALPADIDVFHVEPIQVPGLGAERCIVWMRPRNPAAAPPNSVSLAAPLTEQDRPIREP